MPTACFFTKTPPASLDKQQYESVDIKILKELGFEVTVAHRYQDIPDGMDLYYSWWASGSIFSLIKAKKNRRPNVTVAGGTEAMLYRDSVSGYPYGYLAKGILKRIATRATLRLSSRVLMVSEYMRGDLERLGAKSIGYAPNCINTDMFVDRGLPRRHIATIFSHDAASLRVKRAENIMRAAALVHRQHPDVGFLFIGREAEGTPVLRKLACDLGIESAVTFTGVLENSRIPAILSESIAYVQPSDIETFGVAVAEAMSCGTPVVVSRRGALPEVAGDLGFYVDQNDPTSIAQGMVEAIRLNLQNHTALGQRLRARVQSRYMIAHRREAIRAALNSVL